MLLSMVRRGFTVVEVLLVIGILGGLSAFAVPAWRDYQIRSELHSAAEQVSQALGRAQLRAQAAERGSAWGFSVSHAVLFAGSAFASRDTSADEMYIIPDSIATSGLDEVSFSLLKGEPSATGSIVLTSLRGEKRLISIIIDRRGIAVNAMDKLRVCHCNSNPPHTMHLPEAAWPAHRRHGDYLGTCRVPETRCDD